jgi:hypothetical protein
MKNLSYIFILFLFSNIIIVFDNVFAISNDTASDLSSEETNKSITTWATVAASSIAAIALFANYFETKKNTIAKRGEFWLKLEEMFSKYDEIHLNLRPGGKWSTGKTGPTDTLEWSTVEDYMGLFEHCNKLIDSKVIDLKTFEDIFGYRIGNLLANKIIVDHKLKGPEVKYWSNFIALVNRTGRSIS